MNPEAPACLVAHSCAKVYSCAPSLVRPQCVKPGSDAIRVSRRRISSSKRATTAGSESGITKRFAATYGTPLIPGLGLDAARVTVLEARDFTWWRGRGERA